MFTGLVDSQAIVREHSRLDNSSILVLSVDYQDTVLGESISVNGVCLTVVEIQAGQLKFAVSSETLACSNLGDLVIGDVVNTERAMLVGSRFGGHVVLGHVDTAVQVLNIRLVDDYKELLLGPFSARDFLYLAPKGSVALNGVSLTINALLDNCIAIMLIPHTLEHTNLACLSLGTRLNVEFDYFAKIIAQQLKQTDIIGKVSCD